MANKSLRQYLDEYEEGHRQLGTRLTHMVGIPLILASLPVLPFNPLVGGGMFVGGWILQLIGHYVFEKNDPKFLDDPLNLLVGAYWSAIEWGRVLGVNVPVPASADANA
jgi:uncharacterized membrane protein YGL010W